MVTDLVSDHRPGAQIFANSVWAGRPTPGSVLLNLRFRDESRAEEGSKVAAPIPDLMLVLVLTQAPCPEVMHMLGARLQNEGRAHEASEVAEPFAPLLFSL